MILSLSRESVLVQRTITGTWKSHRRILHGEKSTHTNPSSTFIEKLLLCCGDGSTVVTCWNAVPIQIHCIFLCVKKFGGLTHQIAWSCSFTLLVLERRSINDWTMFNSAVSPDSKPRESWKIKPGLPSNIIWFSISCSPRCDVRILIEHKEYQYAHGPPTLMDPSRVDESIWDHEVWPSVFINFDYIPHLFTIRTENYRISRCIADFSQERCLARVGSPNHEDAELIKSRSYFLNLLISELGVRWGSRHCGRRLGSRFSAESCLSPLRYASTCVNCDLSPTPIQGGPCLLRQRMLLSDWSAFKYLRPFGS